MSHPEAIRVRRRSRYQQRRREAVRPAGGTRPPSSHRQRSDAFHELPRHLRGSTRNELQSAKSGLPRPTISDRV